MKNKLSPSPLSRRGFTLVELLTVIAIIGILAGMLLPVVNKAKTTALKTKAKTEMADIANAIQSYDQDYGRFPITAAEQASAGSGDYTCGYVPFPQPGVTWAPATPGGYGNSGYSFQNNSNVVAILMDLTDTTDAGPTCNTNHVKNPKQVKYLSAKMSDYSPSSGEKNPPGGVDRTGIYRDPWGNPYIITMNTSYNEQGVSDLFYSKQLVSQDGPNNKNGRNGLFNPIDANGNGNNFLYRGKVMVWSAGPNKKCDSGDPSNDRENKDNVLSWQ